MTGQERIEELESDVARLRANLDVAEGERDRLQDDLKDWESGDAMIELECRRCHIRFTGHPDQQWCTRDCHYGWTPAPTYEQWYATLHPERASGEARRL